MKNFKHMKFLAIATFGILFSSVATGQVISQVLAGTVASAIEIYNPSSSNTLSLTTSSDPSGGFEVIVSSNKFANSNVSWAPSSDVTIEPRGTIVLVGAGTQQAALITYLQSIGGIANSDYFVTSLPFEDKKAVRIVLNGTVKDGIGEFQANGNADWCKNCPVLSTIDDRNFERDLEFLQTNFTVGVDVSNPVSSGFEGVYQEVSVISATSGYDVDDFEGLGIAPGNIKFNGTNYFNPSTPSGAATINSTNNCHIEVIGTSSVSINKATNGVFHKVKELVVPAGGDVTLSADASGFSQAKRIKTRGNTASSGPITIRQERYFATAGWHVVGSPFSESFTNTALTTGTPNPNARSWYWTQNPSNTSQMYWEEGTVPEGLGIMVYVDEVSNPVSYAYARVGDEITISGTPHETFEWNTTGGDATLYNLPDGHTGVGSDGINMLSNPFNCTLDWDLVYPNTSNIEPAIAVWSPTVGGWIQYDASIPGTSQALAEGEIPPMAAFDVFVSSGATSASIVASVDNGSPGSSLIYNKNGSTVYPNTISLSIRSTKSVSSHMNTAQIANTGGATLNYDQGLDSRKMINSGNGYPDIYIPGDTLNMYTNHVDFYQNPSVNVGVTELKPDGTYVISAHQVINDGTNDYDLSLEDTYLQTFANLSSEEYTFTNPNEELDPNRFILHINQNFVGINEVQEKGFFTYISNGALYLNSSNLDVSKATIFTIDGRRLFESNITDPVQKLSDVNFTKSLHILQIELESGEVLTSKIIL